MLQGRAVEVVSVSGGKERTININQSYCNDARYEVSREKRDVPRWRNIKLGRTSPPSAGNLSKLPFSRNIISHAVLHSKLTHTSLSALSCLFPIAEKPTRVDDNSDDCC